MTTTGYSRRNFLKLLKQGVAVSAVSAMGQRFASVSEAAVVKPPVTLAPINGLTVTKWKSVLPNPLDPSYIAQPDTPGGTSYTMTVAESWQDYGISQAMIEPYKTQNGGLTKVWGYRNAGHANRWATEPGATFDLDIGKPIQVTFKNGLVTADGHFLLNPMPVDYTVDWANPGALGGFTPVPVTTHLHGGNSQYTSDGLPDSWSSPPDFNIYPIPDTPWKTGRLFNKAYTYDNNLSESGHLWYHDHALGITRLNVNMGLAGNYFLRDANERNLQATNVLPSFPYEVPLALHDRQFMNDGTVTFTAGAGSRTLPVNSMLPEFFGATPTVNSKAWPVLDVEPRKYRFRVLNASDSRFYDLLLKPVTGATGKAPPIMVIGNELGLLDKPVNAGGANYVGGAVAGLSIAPGERYDIVIDFTGLTGIWYFGNTARAPYPAGALPVAGLTDQIMAFNVKLPLNTSVPKATVTTTTALRQTALPVPAFTALTPVRKILLAEGTDKYARVLPMLGTVGPQPTYALQQDGSWSSTPGGAMEGTLLYRDPVTERVAVGTTEVWEFYNTTPDAHPIHMHLVNFRVLNREPFTGKVAQKTNTDGSVGVVLPVRNIALSGKKRASNAWEAGRKDTVQCFPNEVTRILVTFDRPGEYVYHCHILSHEDHDMMRRYVVV